MLTKHKVAILIFKIHVLWLQDLKGWIMNLNELNVELTLKRFLNLKGIYQHWLWLNIEC